jgi:hypothetical protein
MVSSYLAYYCHSFFVEYEWEECDDDVYRVALFQLMFGFLLLPLNTFSFLGLFPYIHIHTYIHTYIHNHHHHHHSFIHSLFHLFHTGDSAVSWDQLPSALGMNTYNVHTSSRHYRPHHVISSNSYRKRRKMSRWHQFDHTNNITKQHNFNLLYIWWDRFTTSMWWLWRSLCSCIVIHKF